MAEDLKNIRLSKHASEIANSIKETGLFDDAKSVAKYAFAYAIKYYPDELTPEAIESYESVYDSLGNNYNVGSIDDDSFISDLLSVMYPQNNTPYRYARIIMCFGLNKIGDLYEAGKLFPINKNL